MSDISGLSSRTPLAFFDPDSCVWKTSRLTFLSDSMSSSLTLPASGMTLGGVLYALPMSGPVTSVPGSSSLPTPTVGDSKSARNATAGRTDPDSQHHSGTTLTDAVTLLPTPAANEYAHSDVDAYLERRERCKESAQNGNGFGLVLSMAVKMLPTPAAADGVKVPDYARMEREDSGGDDLVTTMARMLPTPTSRDHKGRNQRDDETCLPGAVGNLLPTPRSTRGGSGTETLDALGAERTDKERPQGEVLLPTPSAADRMGGHERRGGARGEELLLAGLVKQVSTGESTEPPSSDTSECSVEQLRIL